MSFEIIDTKLEAFKLVHDPTRLLILLYSKYGDIDEDYNLLISNQLLYNRSSHLNITYKEYILFNQRTEFMRRFYSKKESISRIDKLNEYYKNYQSFFCKATFVDFAIGNILKSYQDTKAEIFYKDNYGDSLNKEENDKSHNYYNSSLSSLDNITENKTIFDKKNKQIIESDKNYTISLASDSYRKNNKVYKDSQNLISLSNTTSEISFIESLKNIAYNKIKNKKENGRNKEKNNDLNNIYKKMSDKIKKKENKNEKIKSEKLTKDINSGDNLLSKLNLYNSLNSPINKSKIKISKEYKKPSAKTRNSNNILSNENKDKINNKLYLSPQKNKIYFTNITSRISEFKKYKPLPMKNSKRNKSHHLFNNKKNSEIIFNNVFPNSKNSTYFQNNNQFNEFNIKKEKSIHTSKAKNNANWNNRMQNIKTNFSRISKYNQFLISNKSKHIHKNQKNKTFELINIINKQNNNNSKQNSLFNNFQKLVQSPKHNKIEINNNNGMGSKFTLFKGGNLSPAFFNSINRHNSKRQLNNFQVYNKLNFNKATDLNDYKKLLISSNSLENNMHINSLSPKSISSKLNINSEKNRNIRMNKINNNSTNIQNNIKIINEIKIQPNFHKRNKNNSNSNYNINFNNLFFYGPNTPSNCFDHIKNSIINNQNKNFNINKINTNFYMLSFNNSGNNSHSFNKNKKNKCNNSLNKVKTKVHNNAMDKNPKKNESEKRYNNHKNQGLNAHEKKIHFSINKLIIGKINNYYRKKSSEKVKNIKIELNNKNKNIILD